MNTILPKLRWATKGDYVALIALLIYAALTFWVSAYSSSYMDFLGGRFPVADGFDWLKDSLNAASGYKHEYGAKRPLNVPFNVFFLWLGDRFFADPLPGSLFIKRLISLASILFLTAVSRLRLSTIASFIVGLLLISSLGSVQIPILSDLLGQSLGYTIGTELTTFIVVLNAIALLLLAGFNREVDKPRLALIFYCLGLLLLAMATLMRPGTLFMTPALIGIMVAATFLMPQPGQSPEDRRRALLTWGLVGVMTLLLAKGLELAIFHQLNNTCGVISGNKGSSLLGMSVGGNFRDGEALMKSLKIPQCGQIASQITMGMAMERIRADPRPFLSVIGKNIIGVASNLSLLLPALILIFFSKAGPGSVPAYMHARLKWLAWVAAAGCLSMALFGIAFLGEAGWRPMVPYVVFPAIAYGILVDLIVFQVRSKTTALNDKDGRWVLKPPGAALNLLALIIPLALMGSALMGLGLMKLGALGYRGYGHVSGSIERPASWLRDWQTYNRISPSMSVMYQLSPENGTQISSLGDRICIHYKRQKLPWDFPYGTLRIQSGPCIHTDK